jgi:hypothetical protein
MLNAKKEMVLVHVLVYQNITEILTLAADLNVSKTLTAIDLKLVLVTSVKTLVLEFAE